MIAETQAQAAQRTVEDDDLLKLMLDSGATDDMVKKQSYFNSLERIPPVSITIAKDGDSLVAKEMGNISVKTFQDGDNPCHTIPDALFVKGLKHNLLSVGKLCDKGYEVTFKKTEAVISKNGKAQFTATRNGSLYEVEFMDERNVFA